MQKNTPPATPHKPRKNRFARAFYSQLGQYAAKVIYVFLAVIGICLLLDFVGYYFGESWHVTSSFFRFVWQILVLIFNR